MTRLIGLLLVAATLVLMVSPEAREALRRRLPGLLIYGGAGLLVLLAATGRLSWLFAALGSLLALGRRALPWLRHVPALAALFQAWQRHQDSATGSREHADGHGGAGERRRRGGMSRSDALATLGLGPDASHADIVAAHRRLMQRAHPDRGGTAEAAGRLNEARDVLLGRRRERRAAAG